MVQRKFKTLRSRMIPDPFREGKKVRVCQIQALRDIPRHGVKAGDLGGFIGKKVELTDTGNCWVGGQAIVLGSVKISQDVIITENAVIHGGDSTLSADKSVSYFGITILHSVSISGHAIIDNVTSVTESGKSTVICDKANISGQARLYNVRGFSGKVTVSGEAVVKAGVVASGTILITDSAVVGENVNIMDTAEISGEAQIGEGTKISGASKIGKKSHIPAYSSISYGQLEPELKPSPLPELIEYKEEIPHAQIEPAPATSTKSLTSLANADDVDAVKTNGYLRKYNEISDSISGYSSDIIKLIQYPVMNDLTDERTAEMMFAYKKAEFQLSLGATHEFYSAVEELEKRYLVAESNARRLASSMLSDSHRKKTEQARDLFSLACNDSSSEPEKRTAFKQGFRRLEGVIAIPDEAVQAMRIKVGIQELEM